MKKKWQSIAFIATCAAVLIFFLLAPEGTTPRMPRDMNHADRKNFTGCLNCHKPDTLPVDHVVEGGGPTEGKYKCYFCHKLDEAKQN